MSEEIDILKLVCGRLDSADIPYMLTGSLAANFYAIPRMTRDIDIVVEILESDAAKLFHIFQADFYIDLKSISDAIKHQSMFNIIHFESVYKIDFMICKTSVYRRLEFKRRRQIALHDTKIWVVTPEDLIISKLFWAKDSLSDFQIRDIRNLFTSAKSLDREYIDKWVQTLGLEKVYEKAQANG